VFVFFYLKIVLIGLFIIVFGGKTGVAIGCISSIGLGTFSNECAIGTSILGIGAGIETCGLSLIIRGGSTYMNAHGLENLNTTH
jgi:hypothetical protein